MLTQLLDRLELRQAYLVDAALVTESVKVGRDRQAQRYLADRLLPMEGGKKLVG